MSATKQDLVGAFIRKIAREALADLLLYCDDDLRAILIKKHDFLAREIAGRIQDDYRFAELADIMEWKKTRVRR